MVVRVPVFRAFRWQSRGTLRAPGCCAPQRDLRDRRAPSSATRHWRCP